MLGPIKVPLTPQSEPAIRCEIVRSILRPTTLLLTHLFCVVRCESSSIKAAFTWSSLYLAHDGIRFGCCGPCAPAFGVPLIYAGI